MRILWFVANLARRKTAIYSPVPSVRLRCLMPAHRLTEMHPDWQINVVNLGEIKPSDFGQLDSADVAVFGKVFFDHQPLYEYLSSKGIPIVMDVCDDIYHFAHLTEAYQLLTQYHSKTVVSCAALEATYRQHNGLVGAAASAVTGTDTADKISLHPISQIGDCVEGERRQPMVESFAAKTELNCLWYGIPHNLNFLIYDLPNFKKLSNYKIHIKMLTTIDDEVEQWFESAKEQYSPGVTLEVLKWDFDLQFEALQQCDVVLVPSAENQVFRVKTANRVITALWAGKPCVAYPLPSYQEFQPYIPLNKSTAEGILELLATPTQQINDNIKAAQQIIADQYSLQQIAECWESVINEVIAAPQKAIPQTSQQTPQHAPQHVPQAETQAQTQSPPAVSSPIALNLGCGDKILTGYINVDVVDERAGNHPDVICDIRKLEVFDDDYADEILTVHVIEHFYHWEARDVLLEWLRVLKPGGKMVVECPNLLTACEEVLKNPEQATGPGQEGQRTMWVLYGDPAWRDPLMCHKWLYTPHSLGQLMASCGMENVVQEAAQYKLKAPRDMRLVGYKPEKTKRLSGEDNLAPASMAKPNIAGPSLIDMIGAVGARA